MLVTTVRYAVDVSSADVLVVLAPAPRALDVTTPVELAVAPFDDRGRAGVEPPTAAHEFAAVDGLRRPVAQSALRSERSGSCVRFAEVRGGIEVDEVRLGVRPVLRVLGDQLLAGGAQSALLHLGGAVEAVLEEEADVAEGGKGTPARPQFARAGHSVALALLSHVVFDGLQ